MGNAEAVKGEHQAAVNERGQREAEGALQWTQQAQAGRERGRKCGQDEGQSAIDEVRQVAYRPLEQGTPKNRGAHQQGDLAFIQGQPLAEDRRHTPECAVDDPGTERPDRPQRRDAHKLNQPDRNRRVDSRLGHTGDRNRDGPERDQYGRKGEERQIRDLSRHQEELPPAERQERARHIGCKDAPPPGAGALFVEPAFDDHVQPDDAGPVDHAQDQPDPRLHGQPEGEAGRGTQRRKRRE